MGLSALTLWSNIATTFGWSTFMAERQLHLPWLFREKQQGCFGHLVEECALLIIRLEVQSDKIALQVCPSSMILGITIHYCTAQEAGVSGIKQNGGFGCMNGDGIRVHQ
ncbi:hypothetical protein Peur_008560 [Populus x canadensis]